VTAPDEQAIGLLPDLPAAPHVARRFEAFADAALAVLEGLADGVLNTAEVRIIKPPSDELVLMQTRDSVSDGPFFLGEVLIQACQVAIGSSLGVGYALGTDARRALAAAILDAALNAGHPHSAAINAALDTEVVEAHRRRLSESDLVDRSRVKFEVLDG
jgi:alpha-D-ribose 1-methylphosphonate 5-triphosphate synthase subunit PhnG